MTGCATGFHNNVKPPPEESKKPILDETPGSKDKLNSSESDSVPELIVRPDENAPMSELKQTISPSLLNTKAPAQEAKDSEATSQTCLNQGCSMEFIKRNDNPVCVYHPGEAVFHEGLKFWSCCRKKSMDFDEFLKQKGCVKGDHLWIKKRQVDCRFDWHQTSTHVILTMYTKGYDYRKVKVMANGVKLNANVEMPDGNIAKEWILCGVVNEADSSVLLQLTKIEIKLRKAHPAQWANLTFTG
jgi:cysteine/histidine-rich domain-containing protein